MADIGGLSETDASNTSISGVSMAEGCPPSNHNDAVRNIAGMLKRDWDKRGPTMTTGGSANAHTLTPSVAQMAIVQGDTYAFIAGFTNTGATTLAVSGLTTKAVRLANAALTGGEIVAGQTYVVMYDGTAYQLVSLPASLAVISPYAGFKNALINGDFEVWQRGAGGAASIAVAASSTAYTADRWHLITNANQAHTVSQQAGQTNGSRFSCRVQRNSGQTGAVGNVVFASALTTDMVVALRGSIVTLSAVISTGANWSPTSSAAHSMTFYVGTGAEGKRGGGFTSETSVCSSQPAGVVAGAAAARYTVTSSAVVPTTATQGEIHFEWLPSGTAGANDWVQYDEVQIEIGQATLFDRRPLGTELVHCQRFYRKSFSYATAPATSAGVAGGVNVYLGTGQSGTNGTTIPLSPAMRIAPVVTTYNPSAGNANVRDTTNSADRTITVGTIADASIPLTFASGVAASTNVVHFTADAELT